MPATLIEPVEAPVNAELVTPPRKRWTREECYKLVEMGVLDPKRYELIEGEILQKVGKDDPHVRALILVGEWLRGVFGARLVGQESPVHVSPQDDPTSEPEPDFFVASRSILETPRPHASGLVLVIEVSDTTLAYDARVKGPLYARANIPEYWIFDLKKRRVIRHRDPVDGKYRSIEAFGVSDSISCLAAPEHTVRVDALL